LTKDTSPQTLIEKRNENVVTAVYLGSIFILIGVIYFIHLPNSLWDRIVSFFSSMTLAPLPGIANISLPVPSNPHAFADLYNAAFQFALGIGILEIIVLATRVFLHSPIARKAETVENIVFWLGASYLIATYLVNITIQSEWFVFWSGIILIFGVSLVVRGFVLLIKRFI
jgi:hypothetical protein